MKDRLKVNKKNLKIIGIAVIILALPLTLLLVYQTQNQRSSAASPDQLETEAGVLSSSGVTKQNDSQASVTNTPKQSKIIALILACCDIENLV